MKANYRRFCAAGVLLAAAYTLWINGYLGSLQLATPYPSNPWEAGITYEAARFADGLSNYDGINAPHATHMYGWLNTVFLGSLFRIVPVSNSAGRIVSFLCSLALIVLLTLWIAKSQGIWFHVFAFATLLCGNSIAGYQFAAGRLDMVSILFGAAATAVIYVALSEKRQALALAAIPLLWIGMSFKQTAAAFALIPLVALFPFRKTRRETMLIASLPLLGVGLYVLGAKLGFPIAYDYMFGGFAQYPVPPKVFFTVLWTQVQNSVLLLALLTHFLLTKKKGDDRLRWLFAAAGVLVVTSCAAAAKPGGGPNSLAPWTLASALLTLELVARLKIFDVFAKGGSLQEAGVLSTVLLLWALQQFPGGLTLNRYYLLPDARTADYRSLLQYVRMLPGRVLAPEDPSIPYLARGKHEENFFLHWDRAGSRLEPIRDRLMQELAKADYVIDVRNWMGDHMVNEALLNAAGFRPYRGFGSYSVWRRSAPVKR